MSDELVEALSQRLRLVGEAADHTDDFKWSCWRALPALAAECLRQMEYARRMCACDRGDYVGDPDMPLTLAPDGWKPTEKT